MKQKFRYLGPYERAEIERLHNGGATVAVIADFREWKKIRAWA